MAQGFSTTPITASTLIRTGGGSLAGYLIVSGTAGTVKIWDGVAASGTVLQPVSGAVTLGAAAPTYVTFPAAFATGLYFELGGTISVIPVWRAM